MRFLLALLVVLNLVFFAWTQGALDGVIGVRSTGDREPERLARDVRPDAVRITPVTVAAPAAPDDAVCMESGPYSSSEVALAEVGLSAVASPGMWTTLRQDRPGQWVVYLGPFPDKEILVRKEEEVKRTRVPFEAIRERGELDLGFVLGRFGLLSEANAALERLAQQTPLRNARVVNLVQPTTAHVLRIESASAAVVQRLQGLKSNAVKPFAVCPKP